MNNQIVEDYVTYEVAKLLKDKGFACGTEAGYYILAKDHSDNYMKKLLVDESKIFFSRNQEEYREATQVDEERYHNAYHVCRVPTTALAIKWIRENFGIHISIFPSAITNTEVGDLKGCDTYYARIDNRWNLAHSNDGKNIPYKDYVAYTTYKSWEEAENAAILYTLNNLI